MSKKFITVAAYYCGTKKFGPHVFWVHLWRHQNLKTEISKSGIHVMPFLKTFKKRISNWSLIFMLMWSYLTCLV